MEPRRTGERGPRIASNISFLGDIKAVSGEGNGCVPVRVREVIKCNERSSRGLEVSEAARSNSDTRIASGTWRRHAKGVRELEIGRCPSQSTSLAAPIFSINERRQVRPFGDSWQTSYAKSTPCFDYRRHEGFRSILGNQHRDSPWDLDQESTTGEAWAFVCRPVGGNVGIRDARSRHFTR